MRIAQQPFNSDNDSLGNAARSIVRSRYFDASHEFARRGVDGDDVGERSANVDADPKLSPLAHFWRSAVNA
ncbi:MAG: hypothetical protein ABSD03_17170 [Vulcanimicrobiaceae bacterium]